jgi:plastocyanin
MQATRTLLFASFALLALLGSPGLEAERSAVVLIAVDDLKFAPAAATARVGDRIEWVNGDFIDHTATADDKSWEIKLPSGGKGTLALKQAGTLTYYCRYHPAMTGRIEVEPR